MSNPKNQHFVPQAYLKQFTNNKGLFFSLDITLLQTGKKIKPSAPRTPASLGYKHNYFNIKPEDIILIDGSTLPNLDPLFLEKVAFLNFENNVARIIQTIISFRLINEHDAQLFIGSLVDLKFRNPYYRELIKKTYPALVEKEVKEVLQDVEKLSANNPGHIWSKDDVIKGITDFVDKNNEKPDEYVQQLHNSSLVNKEFKVNGFEKHLPKELLKLSWYVLTTDNKHQFITSDNPGFCFDLATNSIQNTKFKSPFIYYIPLDPNHCLMMSDVKIDQEFLESGRLKYCINTPALPENVREINNATSKLAFKHIVSQKKESLEEIVKIGIR
jgi:Protein of unknown function (DUF4238)